MKTTLDIADGLMIRTKRHVKKRGVTLRTFVEDALRDALQKEQQQPPAHTMKDCSYGDPNGPNPLANMSWSELRDLIYEDR